MSNKAPLLEVKDLQTIFSTSDGVVNAVNGISYSLKSGEALGIVGESGCGKTTLGKTIIRLLDPTSGEIRFDGHPIHNASRRELTPLRRRMQFIFQDPYSSLNPRQTIGNIIGDALELHGLVKGCVAIDAARRRDQIQHAAQEQRTEPVRRRAGRATTPHREHYAPWDRQHQRGHSPTRQAYLDTHPAGRHHARPCPSLAETRQRSKNSPGF